MTDHLGEVLGAMLDKLLQKGFIDVDKFVEFLLIEENLE
jgi:hypothetical protein